MSLSTIICTDDNIHKIVQDKLTVRRYAPYNTNYDLVLDLNHLDVSRVTNFAALFCGRWSNVDISQWNMSSAKNLSQMFSSSRFVGDISKWDVSNVVNMDGMFEYSAFKGDISPGGMCRVL